MGIGHPDPTRLLLTLTGGKGVGVGGIQAFCTTRLSGHASTHPAEAHWGPPGHAVLVVP